MLDIMENYLRNNIKQVLMQIGNFQRRQIDFKKLQFQLT